MAWVGRLGYTRGITGSSGGRILKEAPSARVRCIAALSPTAEELRFASRHLSCCFMHSASGSRGSAGSQGSFSEEDLTWRTWQLN